jgi:hypothetical protein
MNWPLSKDKSSTSLFHYINWTEAALSSEGYLEFVCQLLVPLIDVSMKEVSNDPNHPHSMNYYHHQPPPSFNRSRSLTVTTDHV